VVATGRRTEEAAHTPLVDLEAPFGTTRGTVGWMLKIRTSTYSSPCTALSLASMNASIGGLKSLICPFLICLLSIGDSSSELLDEEISSELSFRLDSGKGKQAWAS